MKITSLLLLVAAFIFGELVGHSIAVTMKWDDFWTEAMGLFAGIYFVVDMYRPEV